MDLIVSHTNADFDALASMVAASLLYPGAMMSLPGGADRNVRDFLSLHGDVIHITSPQDVPLHKIKRLIVVETQHSRRLERFASLIDKSDVEVIIYDHHLAQPGAIKADERHQSVYGANTTLMVKHLIEKGIAIDPLQATIFALGIYEDTGSLTFNATTPEDMETAAWLLRQGANLDIVAEFVNRTLSEGQLTILNHLLASAEIHQVHGLQVLIAEADARGYEDELSLLANKLHDIENSDALFIIIHLDNNVLLVARSYTDSVNAAAIARHFGGGGHNRAASATIHHATTAQVKEQLLPVLEREAHPLVTASTLMSYPVRTIAPDMSVEEAARLMVRYGHGGLTVVADGDVVGMISRNDAEGARGHGLGHAPVSAYMIRQVITISPDAALPEIERTMIEHDIGRLPVIKEDKLVGIVTRSDVLRALHGQRYAARTPNQRPASSRNIWELYIERIPEFNRELLARISIIATERGNTIFLVGGAVRDVLLGNANIDLDILVEGEGIPLAEAVGKGLGGHVVIHPKFHTGKVELPDERHIDFATARTEYYQYPAALPTAEHSSVREDLFRRDFTINAMAMQLNGDEPGRLLDPFGGNRDLAAGVIRVLHNLSLVEDPTRILRAVRFEVRFGFKMNERTEALARNAIELELLQRVSGERIRTEFLQLFARPHPEPGLVRMAELGVLSALEPAWTSIGDSTEYDRFEKAAEWAESEPSVASHLPERPRQRMLMIFPHLNTDAAARLARRLRLRQKEIELARKAAELPALLPLLASDSLSISWLDALLHSLPVPLCILLLALTDDKLIWERVKNYFLVWRLHSPLLTGDDLKRLGIPHGPLFSEIMQALRAARLDGEIKTREEALEFTRKVAQKLP